ncbi:MAG: hypothetical protein ACI4DY_09650 [Monoglobaceae bacterium]
MANNYFSEFRENTSNLLEQTEKLETKIKEYEDRIDTYTQYEFSARVAFERANQLDENGNPVGNVSEAAANLNIARNKLAAANRALQDARKELDENDKKKQELIKSGNEYQSRLSNNIARASRLATMSFAENSEELQLSIIEQYNAIERDLVALLESMGETVSPDYVQPTGVNAGSTKWSRNDNTVLSYKGNAISNSGTAGANTGNESVPFTAPKTERGTIGTQNPISDYVHEKTRIENDRSVSAAEKAAMLKDLKSQLLNACDTTDYDSDDQKKMSLNNDRLSADRLCEMGIKYVDEMQHIWRENLHNRGIDDGLVMDRELARLRGEHIEALGKDIISGDSSVYDIIIDYDKLANKIALDPDYSRSTDKPSNYIYSESDRRSFKSRLKSGEITEAEIRSHGAKVTEMMKSYNDIVSSEFSGIEKSEKKLFDMLKRVKNKDDIETLETYRKMLSNERNRIYSKYGNEQKERVKNVLERFRPIGPINGSKQSYQTSSGPYDSKVIESINTVRNYFPSAWVEEGNNDILTVAFEDRGYYSPSENKIALSGVRNMEACAFHEMSHRLEKMYPEIVEAERQFYNRRTKGNPLTKLGYPYNEKELYREGGFIHKYMGKDYGGSAYELLSMGMESVFCGTFNLDSDPEYRDFIYGILTMF